MKPTTRRRVELVGTIVAGGLIPGWGPLLGQLHAERWPQNYWTRRYASRPLTRRQRRARRGRA